MKSCLVAFSRLSSVLVLSLMAVMNDVSLCFVDQVLLWPGIFLCGHCMHIRTLRSFRSNHRRIQINRNAVDAWHDYHYLYNVESMM
jgi:hypothetical protein